MSMVQSPVGASRALDDSRRITIDQGGEASSCMV